MLVPLAVDPVGEVPRLAATRAATERLKTSGAWTGIDALLELVDGLPAALVATVGPAPLARPARERDLDQRARARRRRAGCAARARSSCARWCRSRTASASASRCSPTTAGSTIGLAADADLVPDLEKLERGLEEAFASLLGSASGALRVSDARPVSPIQRYLDAAPPAPRRARATARSRPTSPSSRTADPSWFGICLATTDGHVYEVGDTRVSRSRSSRSRSRSPTGSRSRTAGAKHVLAQGRRRADGRRLQLDPARRRTAGARSTRWSTPARSPPPRWWPATRPATGCSACSRRSRSTPAARSSSTTPSTARSARPATATARSRHLLRNFAILEGDPEARARPLLPAVLDLGDLPRPQR